MRRIWVKIFYDLRFFFFTTLFIPLFLVGCTKRSPSLAAKPVLRINDFTFNASHFGERLASELKNLDAFTAKDPELIETLKQKVETDLIVEALLYSWAKEHKVFLTQEDVDAEVNKVLADYPDSLTFRRALSEEGISYKDWLSRLRLRLLKNKILSLVFIPPSKEELKKEALNFYQSNKKRYYRPERVKIQQIVLENHNNAQVVLQKLQKGQSMNELAKKYSLGFEATRGGLLGWIPKGISKIYSSAFSLSVGRLSPITKTSQGFLIFKVLSKKSSGYLAFSEVKTDIEQELLEEKRGLFYKTWIENELKKSHVFKDAKFISAIYPVTKGNL